MLPVPPLACPAGMDSAAVQQSEAGRLFLDRARPRPRSSVSTRARRRMWPTAAAASTDCRWRSSWPQPECGPWTWPRWPTASPASCGCWKGPRPRADTGPWLRPSNGPGSFSTRAKATCWATWPRCPLISPSRWPRRWRPPGRGGCGGQPATARRPVPGQRDAGRGAARAVPAAGHHPLLRGRAVGRGHRVRAARARPVLLRARPGGGPGAPPAPAGAAVRAGVRRSQPPGRADLGGRP